MSDEFDIAEIRGIRALLQGYEARCDQVLDAIKEKPLSAHELSRAQDLYRNLKTELKHEAAQLQKRWDTMSRAEQCFSDPAIRKAAIALKPATNSNPSSSNWIGALLDARGEFSYYLLNLNRALSG